MMRLENPHVVLAPDLLGWAMIHDEAGPLLEYWRDGAIQPVANGAWILRCLRLFRRLGLNERQVRYWGWWLSSTEKCCLMPEPPGPVDGVALCQFLARESSARWVIYRALPANGDAVLPESERGGAAWLSLAEFLRSVQAIIENPARLA
jgi:hypothetical protein